MDENKLEEQSNIPEGQEKERQEKERQENERK